MAGMTRRALRTDLLRANPLVRLASAPALAALRVVSDGAPPHLAHTGLRRRPSPTVHPITTEVVTVGRGLGNAVVLLDPSVSRLHASLTHTADGWRVENLTEHNFLWADDVPLASGASAMLAPGAIVRLGTTRLQLIAPAHAAELPSAADGPAGDAWATGAGQVTAAGASGTSLLAPGITLQFALRGRPGGGTGLALVIAGVALLVAAALATVGSVVLVGHDALRTEGIGRVLAALTIPLVPVLGVAAVVGLLDRYEREPLLTLVAAFLWGALIAIPPVLLLERPAQAVVVGLLGGHSSWADVLARAASAGLCEEVVKGAGLVLLLALLRDEFDNLTDGVLYGAVIGAGFAMVENFLYFALSGAPAFGPLVLGRVVLGWLGHSTFTALLGAGLGYAREVRDPRRRILWPALGFGAAVALHTAFDAAVFGADALSAVFPATATVLVAAAYGGIVVAQGGLLRAVLAAHKREAEVIRTHLPPEVASGTVTPDEYILTQDATLRAAAEHAYAFAYGPRAYLIARALYQTETGLAFRTWHVALGDPPKRGPRQPEDAYRARIAKLRRALARQIALHPSPGLIGPPGAYAAPTVPLER